LLNFLCIGNVNNTAYCNELRVGLTVFITTVVLEPQGKQELLVKTRLEHHRWAWGEQVCGMWYFFLLVLWHCCSSNMKDIRPVKSWVLVC